MLRASTSQKKTCYISSYSRVSMCLLFAPCQFSLGKSIEMAASHWTHFVYTHNFHTPAIDNAHRQITKLDSEAGEWKQKAQKTGHSGRTPWIQRFIEPNANWMLLILVRMAAVVIRQYNWIWFIRFVCGALVCVFCVSRFSIGVGFCESLGALLCSLFVLLCSIFSTTTGFPTRIRSGA